MRVRDAIDTWNVYVITDETLAEGRSHVDIARDALAGGSEVIQLRDKTASSRRLHEAALEIRQLTWKAGACFIVNDRLDIALAVNADGVHLGQNDIPAAAIRRFLGQERILGVSVRTVEQALTAEKDGADYLGVGPVFEARGTKCDAGDPAGLELLRKVHQGSSRRIIAIGGINHSNAAQVIEAGAHAVAVISAVVTSDDIAEATRELRKCVMAQKCCTR